MEEARLLLQYCSVNRSFNVAHNSWFARLVPRETVFVDTRADKYYMSLGSSASIAITVWPLERHDSWTGRLGKQFWIHFFGRFSHSTSTPDFELKSIPLMFSLF